MKKRSVVYIILFFAVCLTPAIGMLLPENSSSSENRTLAAAPVWIRDDKSLNLNILSDAGDYFRDHFGFRSTLVNANARLQSSLFGISTASGVICGTDGWLYYKDSLEDYQGTHQLSDRSLFNIAHSLKMMQDYLDSRLVSFVFTVAPNKNTLYPEHMPYYYRLIAEDRNNLDRLKLYLEGEGVRYTDLKELFLQKEEVLYHKRDSHWDNRGAAMAYEAVMDTLNREHDQYQDIPYEAREDFNGDLDQMLFPESVTPETEYYYQKPDIFAYVGDVGSTFDPKIQAVNPSMPGSLVMYRDSFGNALVPFFANSFGSAFFSRAVPYYLSDTDLYLADTVIVERAERFLPDMAKNPPVITAMIAFPDKGIVDCEGEPDPGDFNAAAQGMLIRIEGTVDPDYLTDTSRIYLRINEELIYEACPADISKGSTTIDNGFVIYLDAGLVRTGDTAEVLVDDGEDLVRISTEVILTEDSLEEEL